METTGSNFLSGYCNRIACASPAYKTHKIMLSEKLYIFVNFPDDDPTSLLPLESYRGSYSSISVLVRYYYYLHWLIVILVLKAYFTCSFVLCTIMYSAVAVAGYLMFGDSLKSQFTLNMPRQYLASKVAVWTTVWKYYYMNHFI